jgi:hypothetical protein
VETKLTWINVLALAGVALAWRYPRFGTMPFVLMFLLARIGRRVEARATAQDALLTDRPIP